MDVYIPEDIEGLIAEILAYEDYVNEKEDSELERLYIEDELYYIEKNTNDDTHKIEIKI